MTQPTYEDLAKAMFELHDLIGVSLTLKERKAIQDAMFELFQETLLEKAGTGWMSEKGAIRKTLEQFL